MSKTVTLREANQSFARCVRDVEAGEELTITRNGIPVVRMTSVPERRVPTATQMAAWERLRKFADEGWRLGGGRINRDELYDR
jgi:prevent-host-death family protein